MSRADLDRILKQLKDLRSLYEQELSRLPEGRLLKSTTRGRVRYSVVLNVDGEKKRFGITRDKNHIKALARKACIQACLSVLDNDIQSLQTAEQSFEPFDPAAILAHLPRSYQDFDLAFLFNDYSDPLLMGPQIPRDIRMKAHEAWANAPYERSRYRPEELTISTHAGFMRSKSEGLIAAELRRQGLPFRYEMIIEINGRLLVPDFTFQNQHGRYIFLEFCGLMNDPEYIERYFEKLSLYESLGVVLGRDVICIHEASNRIDMNHVEKVIRQHIAPRL